MKPLFYILFFLFGQSYIYAHNGKLAYAYPTNPKKIDAQLIDWENEEWIPITENFGNPLKGSNDLSARFKIAYNLDLNSLYFITEINDDKFLKDDYYEFYLNGIHKKNTTGVASIIFSDKQIQLRIHEKEKDPYHAQISNENIVYKMRRKENQWIIEGQIILADLVENYKTIGVDHMVVDVDEKGGNKTYLNWGIGYNGFWKEYNSGQLGDIVLIPNAQAYQTVSGMITWEGNKSNLQKSLRISSKNKSKFWIDTELDSIGNFTAKLPRGAYYISPSYPLTNPFLGDGYSNQRRTDLHFRKFFSVENNNIKLPEIEFPVYEFPNYLMKTEGSIDTWNLDTSPKELTSFIKTLMEYYNVPGVSVAVIKNGTIVYDEVFGVRSSLSLQPITKQTHFQAASVTKSVFAFIVNRLVDRGEFDLDTPLHLLLPFENYASDLRYKKITGRMVLNHTSGMPNWAFGGPGGYKSGTKGELLFEPGSKFSYSGEAFEYLARVISKISGKNINELLENEVIKSLNIAPLYFVGDESLELAQGHLQYNPTYWGGYATEPGVAHSMLTNGSNFAKFVLALAQQKGLSSKQYKAMFESAVMAPGFPMSPDNNYWNLGMGLGFFTQETVRGKAVMHGGSNYDFQSEFVLYPESKDGFVIFTNSNTGHKLGQALGKHLFYGGVKKQQLNPN